MTGHEAMVGLSLRAPQQTQEPFVIGNVTTPEELGWGGRKAAVTGGKCARSILQR